MEKLLPLVTWNRPLFIFVAHAMVTLRFWQVLRRSRDYGLSESVAAAGHLALARALRGKGDMTIPTYDADQSDYPVRRLA